MPEQIGVHGARGVPASTNVPGARYWSVSRTDTTGNLWLFGGNAFDSAGSQGLLNDLWKFSNSAWTWMSGSNLINQNGVYGTQRTAAPGNIPGARLRSAVWIDPSGNLWLFGGFGFSTTGSGDLGDLWMYTP